MVRRVSRWWWFCLPPAESNFSSSLGISKLLTSKRRASLPGSGEDNDVKLGWAPAWAAISVPLESDSGSETFSMEKSGLSFKMRDPAGIIWFARQPRPLLVVVNSSKTRGNIKQEAGRNFCCACSTSSCSRGVSSGLGMFEAMV